MDRIPASKISIDLASQQSLKGDAPKPKWKQIKPHEKEFLIQKKKRINYLIEFTTPYWDQIRENFRLMEGKFTVRAGKKQNDVMAVMPIARSFVESKTAEEVKVSSDYRYIPKKGTRKSIFAVVIDAMRKHVHRKTHYQANRHAMTRVKNIAGVSIKRKGYRFLEQHDKIPLKFDEQGRPVEWDVKKVPVYDDLFEEIVSPLQFAVDPLAETLNDAEDCYYTHIVSEENFFLQYQNSGYWVNTDSVEPGKKFAFNDKQEFAFEGFIDGGGIQIEEYFHKILNEWVVTANGVLWRKGDPQILKDLILLETGLTQAMFRNAKLASQSIIATERGYKFKSKNWKSGQQAVGMKGRYEVTSLATTQQGQIQPLLDFLFQMKVLAIGLDPRNISQDSKTKSATEAAIIQETSMRRLQENIEYNIQHSDLRDAEMDLKLIAQYYSVAEVQRITEEDDIEGFDEVEYVEVENELGEKSQKPVIGKKFRIIDIDIPVTEEKSKETGKYILMKDNVKGQHSFMIRPEYIDLLDVDIEMVTNNKLGEIRSVQKSQNIELVNLFTQLLQMQQSGAIEKSDLPPFKEIMRRLMVSFDMYDVWSQQEAEEEGSGNEELAMMKKGMEQYQQQSLDAAALQDQVPQDPSIVSSSPNVDENIAG